MIKRSLDNVIRMHHQHRIIVHFASIRAITRGSGSQGNNHFVLEEEKEALEQIPATQKNKNSRDNKVDRGPSPPGTSSRSDPPPIQYHLRTLAGTNSRYPTASSHPRRWTLPHQPQRDSPRSECAGSTCSRSVCSSQRRASTSSSESSVQPLDLVLALHQCSGKRVQCLGFPGGRE